MTSFIAIDGGGTGSRALLRQPGQADLQITGGPCNAFTDLDGAAHCISTLIAELSAQAKIPTPPVTAGIAGCRLPEITEALAVKLPRPAQLTDDSITTAKGALGDADGTVISLGTGSFFLRQFHGQIRSLGGWGLTLGDRASGAWFGREALSLTLRAEDGLWPHDALTRSLLTPHPLMASKNKGPDHFATLATAVLSHPNTATAQHLIALAVAEITEYLSALGTDPSEPLILTGGLGPSLAPHLPADLQTRLTPARGTSLDGAIALAVEAAR